MSSDGMIEQIRALNLDELSDVLLATYRHLFAQIGKTNGEDLKQVIELLVVLENMNSQSLQTARTFLALDESLHNIKKIAPSYHDGDGETKSTAANL